MTIKVSYPNRCKSFKSLEKLLLQYNVDLCHRLTVMMTSVLLQYDYLAYSSHVVVVV
jgi:hypothetical protein